MNTTIDSRQPERRDAPAPRHWPRESVFSVTTIEQQLAGLNIRLVRLPYQSKPELCYCPPGSSSRDECVPMREIMRVLNASPEALDPADEDALQHQRRQVRQWLASLKVRERHPLQWLHLAETANRLQGAPRLSAWLWRRLQAQVTLIELRQALQTSVAALQSALHPRFSLLGYWKKHFSTGGHS